MYAGSLVEVGPTDVVYWGTPAPVYDRFVCGPYLRLAVKKEKIKPIYGNVPDLAGLAGGCPFAPRW